MLESETEQATILLRALRQGSPEGGYEIGCFDEAVRLKGIDARI